MFLKFVGYKKCDIPTLEDKVWRVEKIAKNGPFCKALAQNGITLVKHFLRQYYKDKKALRNVRLKFCLCLFMYYLKVRSSSLSHATYLLASRFSAMPQMHSGKRWLIMRRGVILGVPFTLTLLMTRILGCSSVLWVRLLG